MNKTLGDIADELLKVGTIIKDKDKNYFNWQYHGLTDEEKIESIFEGLNKLIEDL